MRPQRETRPVVAEDRPKIPESAGAHPIVWSAAILSSLLVLALLAFLVRQALLGREGGPELAVLVTQVEATADGYRVRLAVSNRAAATAASVAVKGELSSEDGAVESATITFDYVPGQSERKGALFFRHDPRHYRMEVAVEGYRRP